MLFVVWFIAVLPEFLPDRPADGVLASPQATVIASGSREVVVDGGDDGLVAGAVSRQAVVRLPEVLPRLRLFGVVQIQTKADALDPVAHTAPAFFSFM